MFCYLYLNCITLLFILLLLLLFMQLDLQVVWMAWQGSSGWPQASELKGNLNLRSNLKVKNY